jgi:hypothetical protein
MAPVLQEVLAAQRSLCRQFRRQGQARHAARATFRHPAWTPGSTLPNTPALPKATPM